MYIDGCIRINIFKQKINLMNKKINEIKEFIVINGSKLKKVSTISTIATAIKIFIIYSTYIQAR
jgi:hypothetical protein